MRKPFGWALAAVSCAGVLALGVSSVAAAATATASWRVVSVPAAGRSTLLEGISCPTTTFCMAVGVGPGDRIAETFNGRTWRVRYPIAGPSFSSLTAVSCRSADTCAAVGENGKTLQPMAESWNGKTWRLETTARVPGQRSTDFDAVSCPSVSTCIAVGQRGGVTGGDLGVAEMWHSGGKGWVLTANDLSASNSGLEGVSCVSATHCIAVGYSGNANVADTWNGTKWTRSVLPGTGVLSQPSSVSCVSTSHCVAVTEGGAPTSLVLEGKTWTVHATPKVAPPFDSSLFSLSCPSTTSCTAVGYKSNGSNLDDSSVLAEQWNGLTWRAETTPPPAEVGSDFFGVACPLSQDCIAVGDQGGGTAIGLVEQRAA